MWRVVLLGLILLTGCASSRHEVEGPPVVVEKEAHEHHGHHQSTDDDSGNIGQDVLEDVESGILGGIFQAIIDAIFHRGDED